MTDKTERERACFFDSLMEGYTQSQFEMVARSFFLLPKEERRRRLKAIINLSIELGRIRDIDIHATGLGEIAIENLIEGDLDGVKDWAEHFTFNIERQGYKDYAERYATLDYVERYATLWSKFRELLLAAATPQSDIQ